jgi:hypothetical protein
MLQGSYKYRLITELSPTEKPVRHPSAVEGNGGMVNPDAYRLSMASLTLRMAAIIFLDCVGALLHAGHQF